MVEIALQSFRISHDGPFTTIKPGHNGNQNDGCTKTNPPNYRLPRQANSASTVTIKIGPWPPWRVLAVAVQRQSAPARPRGHPPAPSCASAPSPNALGGQSGLGCSCCIGHCGSAHGSDRTARCPSNTSRPRSPHKRNFTTPSDSAIHASRTILRLPGDLPPLLQQLAQRVVVLPILIGVTKLFVTRLEI